MKTYSSHLGKLYTVDDRCLGAGGEGRVCPIFNQRDLVAKMYEPSKTTEHQAKKLIAMLSYTFDPEVASQFAWPVDILYDRGKLVGFVMPRITGEPLNVMYSDRYRGFPISKKLIIAKNLCVAVDQIHRSGNVIGDLNPNNIFVMPRTGLVRLIDCDSFHITDKRKRVFRCEVGIPEYLAPEVHEKMGKGDNLRTAQLPTFTEKTDCFALAIHIFQLLTNGTHPFAIAVDYSGRKRSVKAPQPSDNIKKGVFPHKKCPTGYRLPVYAVSFDVFPETMQQKFIKCFAENGTVTPAEWYEELTRYEQQLKTCARDPSHEYRRSLRSCPYCTAIDNTASFLASGTGQKKKTKR